MDLQTDAEFRNLGIELVSVAADHPDSWSDVANEYAIEPSLLVSDPFNRVANRFGVMRWRVPPTADVERAEPGHTFVLVDQDRQIVWIRDYGARENGGLMYVPPGDLMDDMRAATGA